MNHPYPPRGMVPQGAPSQRLNELLESIRGEFETESQRSVDYESQSECFSTYIWISHLARYRTRTPQSADESIVLDASDHAIDAHVSINLLFFSFSFRCKSLEFGISARLCKNSS
jgi:hypothetical protein